MKHCNLCAASWLAALLFCLPLAAKAAPPASTTLAEAWLGWLEARDAPLDWGYSFALREDDADELASTHEALIQRLEQASPRDATQGLREWHATLLALAGTDNARSAERLDLPYLLADLRRNPALSHLRHLGTCQVPDWIEVWSADGVDRLPWLPGMQIASALAALPNTAFRHADDALLVNPTGTVTRLGIASWNREPAPLAAGSRLVVVPTRLMTKRTHAEMLSVALAEYLSTRLPGDDCEVRTWP